MRLINFNHFDGFEQSEDIFVDTGILLAFLNEYDPWHPTVNKLFTNHIFENPNEICLYTHAAVISEVAHLAEKPLDQYMRTFNFGFCDADVVETAEKVIDGLDRMIELDLLEILESNKGSLLHQIRYSRELGATDALIASIVQEYGISLLTVDSKLARRIAGTSTGFHNINNIYFTNSIFMYYQIPRELENV